MLHEGVKVPGIIHVACIAENTLVQALAGNFFFTILPAMLATFITQMKHQRFKLHLLLNI